MLQLILETANQNVINPLLNKEKDKKNLIKATITKNGNCFQITYT